LQQSNTQQPVSKPKRATLAFALSLAGAVVILAQGLVRILRGETITFLGSDEIRRRILAGLALTIVGTIAIVFAVLIIIGAFFIYNPETQVIGGVLVLIFSALSIIAGGGWLIGLILGIIGGVICLIKK
jgi:hypothetical protein